MGDDARSARVVVRRGSDVGARTRCEDAKRYVSVRSSSRRSIVVVLLEIETGREMRGQGRPRHTYRGDTGTGDDRGKLSRGGGEVGARSLASASRGFCRGGCCCCLLCFVVLLAQEVYLAGGFCFVGVGVGV